MPARRLHRAAPEAARSATGLASRSGPVADAKARVDPERVSDANAQNDHPRPRGSLHPVYRGLMDPEGWTWDELRLELPVLHQQRAQERLPHGRGHRGDREPRRAESSLLLAFTQ